MFGLSRPTLGIRRIRAQVLVRSRYAEDRLEALLDQGVEQFVMLAAGLDSFALRRTDLAERLRVFELDHPDTQRWKSQTLRSLAISPPENLELVPCDFEKQKLAEALATSSYDPKRPALFSWLGVSYYLSLEAIRDTFLFLADQASGSELVFDYWTADSNIQPADRVLLDSIRGSVAAQGERMLSFFEPADLRALLEECGLELVEDLDARTADARFLKRRADGLRMPDFAHLVAARTG